MKIYIKMRYENFWYGVHGLTDKSCNDEFWMYSDKAATELLGYFDVYTKECLIDYISENEEDGIADEELNSLKSFQQSDMPVLFDYIYPTDNDDKELGKLFAPENELGKKPSYIIVWTKIENGWDIERIKECAKMLAMQFLHESVEVEILDIPTFEEVNDSYKKDWEPLIRKYGAM